VTEDDTYALVNSDTAFEPGDTVRAASAKDEEATVYGVVGTGMMGRGLVELLLSRGHRVIWVGRSEGSIFDGRARVIDRLSRVLDETEVQAADERLMTETDYQHLKECDVVIESVVEDLDTKLDVLASAEREMRDDAILATNTSGLPLDVLAGALARPSRFGGLHFFNPPNRMKLVETVLSDWSAPETGERLDEIARSLGKVPVRVAATPAFAANRVLMPLINEAIRELEEGVAPAESIDDAVRYGLNHPMGPLALADLIGLDILVSIMDNLADGTGDESYRPRPLLRDMAKSGCLGRKSGSGFYEYQARPSNVT
jgi:3-hydroxybutyryl-CoA dehydrogenase